MSHGPAPRGNSVSRAAPYEGDEPKDKQLSVFGSYKSKGNGGVGSTGSASGEATSIPVPMDDTELGNQDGRTGGRGRAGRGNTGGRGKGRGGQGKGTGAKGGKNTDTDNVLQTHAKALLQLDNNYRQREKEVQWALVFPEDNDLANVLEERTATWKNDRPKNGPHPLGLIHEYLWCTFCDILLDKIKEMPDDLTAPCIIRLKRFLEDSTAPADSYKPHGRRTYLDIFRPVQAKKPNGANWIWIIRPSMSIKDGRDLQECLTYHHDDLSSVLHPITLQRDRMPQSGLFKAVEAQLKALQI